MQCGAWCGVLVVGPRAEAQTTEPAGCPVAGAPSQPRLGVQGLSRPRGESIAPLYGPHGRACHLTSSRAKPLNNPPPLATPFRRRRELRRGIVPGIREGAARLSTGHRRADAARGPQSRTEGPGWLGVGSRASGDSSKGSAAGHPWWPERFPWGDPQCRTQTRKRPGGRSTWPLAPQIHYETFALPDTVLRL